MKQQQASVSIDKQSQPIEFTFNVVESSPQPKFENACSPNVVKSDYKRLDVMKRKIDPTLDSLKKGKKKQVSQSFQELAENKKSLVKAQETLIDSQIRHQQLQIELAEEKLKFEKKKNEMELEFLKQKYELELDLLRNK